MKRQYNVGSFMKYVKCCHPHQSEFHQAVREVVTSLIPFIDGNPKYFKYAILERLIEPERVFIFQVPWMDDNGIFHVNRGYRIQMNHHIGRYKGGLRLHKNVNLSILKFLAFEQQFKNSLTGLLMGGAKGGSDFDPKGKSDNEIMRFCQSFMIRLFKYIGEDIDVPAGDIGVGAREIGYLYGTWLELTDKPTGVVTGKSKYWGGSLIRPEATGYGSVWFAEEMLKTRDESLKGKICIVSGKGNVAQYTLRLLNKMGAKPVTTSDSDGFVFDPDGIDEEKTNWIMELHNTRKGRISEYVQKFPHAIYTPVDPKLAEKRTYEPEYGENPIWSVPAQCAFPSATQNEINEKDAEHLLNNSVYVVCEGANMPSTIEAVNRYIVAKILYGPGKAANAGGVATSGLEMAQNFQFTSWEWDDVAEKLHKIMIDIHKACVKYGKEDGGFVNYVNGANIAGFVKIADSMIEHGVI